MTVPTLWLPWRTPEFVPENSGEVSNNLISLDLTVCYLAPFSPPSTARGFSRIKSSVVGVWRLETIALRPGN